ncbi:hypothetical protein K474DRAFT_1745053 [Panus rudis PR-1116 ss-1]|nr:hypothetical protein K474DRAFT_1745053 [Panus rudis PR-1116 ss-1]
MTSAKYRPPENRPRSKHTETEEWWKLRQPFLESRGYRLRPRYCPGWIPSWRVTGDDPDHREDGVLPTNLETMDATRISDGKVVIIKRFDTSFHPSEISISTFLSLLQSDPENHCVPVYDVLRDPFHKDLAMLVMPLLRRPDYPPFKSVGEALECIRQLLVGLRFMHRHLVAHRDCTWTNVMMDASPMYPESFHPQAQSRTPDLKGKAKHYNRTSHPVKYYFVNFGISVKYQSSDKPLAYPALSDDTSVPENKLNRPLDPFAVDVYIIGNLIRENFIKVSVLLLHASPTNMSIPLQKYCGLGFLKPFVQDLVETSPSERPTMDEVVPQYEQLLENLHWYTLRKRLRKRKESPLLAPIRNVRHLFRAMSHFHTPSIPCAT